MAIDDPKIIQYQKSFDILDTPHCGQSKHYVLHSINDLMKAVKSQPTWKDFQQLEAIQQLWTEIVGDVVAANSKPIRLHHDVLTVATSSPTWAQNLAFQRSLIIKKINPHLTRKISSLKFRPGTWHQWKALQEQSDRPANQRVRPQQPSVPRAETPKEAFERWALRMKQVQASENMHPCPRCYRPTPPAELERSYVCRYCARDDRP